MLSFQQLATPVTEDQALDVILVRLTELGFSGTSWQSGSPQLTICRAAALLYSKATELVQTLLYAGYNDFAEGEYLTRFSLSNYDNTRVAAVAAQYTVRHTVAAGEGPYTVAAGALLASNGTYKYRSLTGATLTSATPTDIVYQAEIPGSAPTAADNTITTLITTLVGVTITNPLDSLVRAGADEETDASLRIRNSTKWATLSVERPSDGYKHAVLSVLPNFRVVVDDTNPQGPGTVDIYIASATGVAGGTDETTAQTEVDRIKSPTATVDVIIAASTAINVIGDVYIQTAYNTAATQLAIEEAVADYINSLDIGGVNLGASRVIPLDGIEGAIRSVQGVKNVDLSSPAADTTITQFDVAILGTLALSYTGI